jgi:hypothetical protein
MDRDSPRYAANGAAPHRAPETAHSAKTARITQDEIARAARELVAAYGPAAIHLMRQRTRAVRRRGDAESATLWLAVADAIEQELGVGRLRS